MTTPATIAAKLSEAQRAALLAMPTPNAGSLPDEQWRPYMQLFADDLAVIYKRGDEMGLDVSEAGAAVRAALMGGA